MSAALFKLTDQQHEAIQSFSKASANDPMIVEARAGCGKTTMIEHGCRSHLQSRILLLCHNKTIADAAKARMPANVTAKTFSSWTWNTSLVDGKRDSTYGRVYGDRKDLRFSVSRFATMLRVEDHLVHAAKATLNYFISTADPYITHYHVPKNLWIGKPKEEQTGFKDEVVGIARKMWRMKMDKSNKFMPVLWNDITKMVQLSKSIQYSGIWEYVIVDEAQDITACVLDLIKQTGCPAIYVGDSYQQLYAFIFTKELNSIQGFRKYITESQRFDQLLADWANTVLALLKDKVPKIIGHGEKTEIRYSEPQGKHTVLCRSNMGLLSESLKAIRAGKTIHVMGKLMDSVKQLESGYFLSIGQPDKVTHPSLLGVKDWNEVEAMKDHDSDMALLFRQVNNYGSQIPHFCEELQNAGEVAECRADIVLSTVHKAKGREWEQVKMSNDFQKLVYFSEIERKYKVKRFEVYTTYVALTRAKKVLYPNDILGQCKGWLELL